MEQPRAQGHSGWVTVSSTTLTQGHEAWTAGALSQALL